MIYESKLWYSDLDEIISSLGCLKELEGKTILVTGAGGLICSAVVDVFIRYNELHSEKIIIYTAGRDESKIRNRFGDYSDKSYFHFVKYDANDSDVQELPAVDYIIHGAGNAFPEIIMREPVETMLCNVIGVLALLKHAKNCNTKRLLYISSSEIYGIREVDEPAKETELSRVSLLNPRNSYSISKCAAETLCISYADEYHIDTVVVRPGHIYGPTASEKDNRVSSSWAYSAAHGDDILMKSDGRQIRSYTYCLDCASAIITVLIRGRKNEAYNISNPDSVINIQKMANILAEYSGVKIQTVNPSVEEKKSFNIMINSSLDSSKLQELGWKGLFDSNRGFAHTVQIIKKDHTERGENSNQETF